MEKISENEERRIAFLIFLSLLLKIFGLVNLQKMIKNVWDSEFCDHFTYKKVKKNYLN